jgi:hypothetical protein
VLGVVLAAGAGGALVVWRVMKSEAPASVAATATQTVATSPPRENDHSLDPPPSATSTAASPPPTATATATTTTAIGRGTHSVTGGAGVAFITMETVGAIKSLEVDDFTKHAVASAQRCRPPHGNAPAVARVKLVGIHDNGEIAIVTPAPPDQVGDPIAARCIGNVLKSIAGPTTLHPSGGGGIATVEATLDPL